MNIDIFFQICKLLDLQTLQDVQSNIEKIKYIYNTYMNVFMK